MRVLVIGNGQLGSALNVELQRLDISTTVLGHRELEIRSEGDGFLNDYIWQAVLDSRPEVIFHTAEITKVNYCEEHEEEAFTVNSLPLNDLVQVAEFIDCRLLYFSTDYVLAGSSGTPLTEEVAPRPLNVYGKSKWAGEMHVGHYAKAHTIRTSGVFGPRADGTERNFFRAIFDKLTQTAGPIEVVDDQFTCVTYAPHLAAMVLELLPELPRIAHLTSAGADSWYGWARQLALVAGFDPARIVPVPSDPGSPVRRPAYSVLGSRYEHINRLIGQFPATRGIADYVLQLQSRI
jgi:dTDP-4-dehydrorhamnose reductase